MEPCVRWVNSVPYLLGTERVELFAAIPCKNPRKNTNTVKLLTMERCKKLYFMSSCLFVFCMNYKAQRAPVPGVHYIVLTPACTWSADCYVTENSDTSNNDNTEYTFVNFRSVGFIRRIRPVRVPLTNRGLKVTPSLVRRAAPNKLHRYLSQN